MIIVKRLGGASFALNPDLIERIESAPDTILVMVDATRYIVEEPVSTVIELIKEDRARLLARVEQLLNEDPYGQESANGRAVLSVAYSASEKEEKED